MSTSLEQWDIFSEDKCTEMVSYELEYFPEWKVRI